MKKVVVISGTDHYEERMKSVIEEYQKEHEVIYVTSDFNHVTKERYRVDLPFAQQIHVPEYKKNISVARIMSHIIFSVKTYGRLCKIKPDIVYVEIPHNTLAVATKWYKKFHSCELIMDIFDMWPESLPMKKSNPVFQMMCKVWRGFRNRNLKYADKVYTECNYYQELIRGEGCNVPMETKYLTRKKVDVNIETQWEEDVMHICYVGNINNIIDIPFMADFLAAINSRKKVVFHLIGNGESRTKMIDAIEKRGIRVISYGVVYDVHRLQEILNRCYLGVNFLLPDLAIGLTMKSVTYLRAGLPLLNTVDGDTWDMVEQFGCGINLSRNHVEKAVEQLLQMREEDIREMKQIARKVFEEHFAEE